jgi:hypothetical protein
VHIGECPTKVMSRCQPTALGRRRAGPLQRQLTTRRDEALQG